jgi:uncharacterized protein (TIGR03382 family)
MTRGKVTGLAVVALLLPLGAARAGIPHATCRSTDRPETGMSGETTAAEIAAGAPAQGFKCNTDLIGQYQGEGASWQLTAWKNCAYFDQRNNAQAGSTTETHPGSVVVDVSDPTAPVATAWLADPALIDPWESIKVNHARQLLAGDQRPLSPPGYPTSPGDGFSVYDISTDCAHPVKLSSVLLPGSIGHTGQWAPDGKTYYVTPLRTDVGIIAVDVNDPTKPSVIDGGIYTFTAAELPKSQLHDTEFSKDGNTAYVTMFGFAATAAQNGLGIIDVSDFQQRRPNPKYRVISFLTWDDGSIGAQDALPITIAGKPYILMADEGGGGIFGSCAQGKSANGFPRLIDISDPTHPTVVSKITLDVADPANCTYITAAPVTSSQTTLADGGVQTTLSQGFFGHSCHYCNVDDPDDAKVAACNCFAAGFRFFDIHDPANPKEMAYFKPPAQGAKVLPASQYANNNVPLSFVRQYDWSTSQPSFPKNRGDTSGDVWTTSQDNGFMVIRLFSSVSVSPSSIGLTTGTSTTFTATVDGAAKTAGVVWSVSPSSGASVTDAGVFTATIPGVYTVVATALLDSAKHASAAASVVTPSSSSSSGCSATSSSVSSALAVLVVLGWVLWRRRRTSQP